MNHFSKNSNGNPGQEELIALVCRRDPEPASTELPVDALLATAYALRPERLHDSVRQQLDGLFEQHLYFKEQIEKLRRSKSYYMSMETAE